MLFGTLRQRLNFQIVQIFADYFTRNRLLSRELALICLGNTCAVCAVEQKLREGEDDRSRDGTGFG